VDKLVKDVAEQAREKQKLNENLIKYQIALVVLFTAMLLMLVYFVQPWEDKDHVKAAHSAFDKFKGDDEKLNVSELKLAFDSLVNQHQLPENSVGDLRRILESYDVHDACGSFDIVFDRFCTQFFGEAWRVFVQHHAYSIPPPLSPFSLFFGFLSSGQTRRVGPARD